MPLATGTPLTGRRGAGDTATELTITAADEPLGSGTYVRIERWDGGRWVLQHYVWHGEVQPADLDGFNDDGYGIEPARPWSSGSRLTTSTRGAPGRAFDVAGRPPGRQPRRRVCTSRRPGLRGSQAPAAPQLDGSEAQRDRGRSRPPRGPADPAHLRQRAGRCDCGVQRLRRTLRAGRWTAGGGRGGVLKHADRLPRVPGQLGEWVLLGSPTVDFDDER